MAESGGCRRRCFNNILWFTAVLGMTALLLGSVKHYTTSQITALEKQFGLSSTKSGLLLSCNEIGYLSASFFFSHFGGRRFIPRILSGAMVLYGIASLMCGMLHFMDPVSPPSVDDLASNYSSSQRVRLCQDSVQEHERCPASKDQATDKGRWMYNVLAVLIALQGVGKSPRFSLGLPYVENNARDKQQSSLLTGIIMAIAFLGPAVALGLGGWISDVPFDLSESQLDSHHPQWISAWWIGYLIFGCAALVLAVPLGCFPRHMKKSTVKDIHMAKSLKKDIVDLPRSILRILKNPVVACLLFGNGSALFFVGGYFSFAPKYIETQFAKTAAEANFILGILELMWALVGTLLGGIITSRFRLTSTGCMKLTTILVFSATVLCSLTLVFGCDDQNIKGLGDSRYSMVNDTVCNCGATEYMPLCGVDGVTYINPCMAGCKSQNGTTYMGCSEIPGNEGTVGKCPFDCPYLYPYVIVDLMSGLSATISLVPVMLTLMRTVHPRDKSMAVAISSFLSSFVGYLPAPIVYGKAIDTTCTLWETRCGEVGACAVYNLPSLRHHVKGMDTGFQILSSAGFFAAFLLLKNGVVEEYSDSDAPQTQPEESEDTEKCDVQLTQF
ncbi:solute carrier organic anion transporter family member 2A1-like [Haliotis rubra]|uniref:solute carrier organic anion transporter family member 2A1-like n=1 Tax=Haliotis rubra TaxID=36100 RepID=UPI001EE5935B|nr:solute carrier organic anion transporter family member 2A1-like [Haliotis rubra]